ncbi:SipW-dependent-type signal peptide-containing protein [Halosegnis marinus]|uniref:SipW-dependent-type signal peptide-containing protein n=1 Tax=Halosegnis marinus TaxID=3034023 RepID=A0ABD5ZMP7_9EURY|nr:SipW-dependent-type signal peptide-containing protein [Halosegnis sp. DT85]
MQQDSKPQLYSLSRRKMLAGLGAVGLASAGAGLGTSALFSDEESFTNNTLTAGTLDMSVTATLVAADPYWSGQVDIGSGVTADGNYTVFDSQGNEIEVPTFSFTANDIKPGDWGIICFEIEVEDNPGYVQVRTESFAEAGGANPEPEQDAEGDMDNDADLGQYLLTTVWQNYDEQVGGKAGLQTLDPVFNNASDILGINYAEPVDLDGVVDADTHYTNAREANTILENGYIIKDDAGDNLSLNSYEFCLLFEVPRDVGNVIQGDSLGFDLVFETEQARHNDDPFNASA